MARTKQRIAHLRLKDSMGGKTTLICWFDGKWITYVHYGGWQSSGTPHALSNLQCQLPYEAQENETMEGFKYRLIAIIERDSICTVDHEVKPTKFAD